MATATTTPRRHEAARARRAVTALEVLLWAVLTVVLLTQLVRPLVGPALLGWVQGPYWGTLPSIQAHLSGAAWAEAAQQAAAAGTTLPSALLHGLPAGKYIRGEAVGATLPTGLTVSVLDPDLRQAVGTAVGPLLGGLVVIAALLLAILVVRDLRRGLLFTTTNLHRAYAAAAVLAVGGTLAELAGAWGRVGILRSPRIAGYVDVDWSISLTPLVLGLAIAGGAEILRLGTRMQDDVEGLV